MLSRLTSAGTASQAAAPRTTRRLGSSEATGRGAPGVTAHAPAPSAGITDHARGNAPPRAGRAGSSWSNGNGELSMTEAAVGMSVLPEDRASYDQTKAKFRTRTAASAYLASDGTLSKTVPSTLCGGTRAWGPVPSRRSAATPRTTVSASP
ncbi:hypothetical protein GCM10010282_30540 [Streptomyces roseolus]|nr:hypothetical protein GCM10010282_30540 [Streptomyces roseolus]